MTIGSGSSARTGNSLTPGIFPKSVLISGMGISIGSGPAAGAAVCAFAAVAAIAIPAMISTTLRVDVFNSWLMSFRSMVQRVGNGKVENPVQNP